MTMTLARAIWRLDETVVVTGRDYTTLPDEHGLVLRT